MSGLESALLLLELRIGIHQALPANCILEHVPSNSEIVQQNDACGESQTQDLLKELKH